MILIFLLLLIISSLVMVVHISLEMNSIEKKIIELAQVLKEHYMNS